LETKIDIVKKAQEEYVINGILKKPFEPIYFDYLLAENELNHDCNKGV
jgi:hypothetical protein